MYNSESAKRSVSLKIKYSVWLKYWSGGKKTQTNQTYSYDHVTEEVTHKKSNAYHLT